MPGRCGKCQITWEGMRECHCGACHEQFNSLAAFDRHREGQYTDRTCIPADRLTEPYGRDKKPRLVSIRRSGRNLWVTGLRDA